MCRIRVETTYNADDFEIVVIGDGLEDRQGRHLEVGNLVHLYGRIA